MGDWRGMQGGQARFQGQTSRLREGSAPGCSRRSGQFFYPGFQSLTISERSPVRFRDPSVNREAAVDTSQPVLVVDDSRAMTTILRRLLHEVGFTDVDDAHDGGSALERLGQKAYRVMISDWEMQPMTGPQLVQAIRQNPALSETRIILITAHGVRHDEAWLVGADGYLSKPFSAPVLGEKIEEVLSAAADQMKS